MGRYFFWNRNCEEIKRLLRRLTICYSFDLYGTSHMPSSPRTTRSSCAGHTVDATQSTSNPQREAWLHSVSCSISSESRYSGSSRLCDVSVECTRQASPASSSSKPRQHSQPHDNLNWQCHWGRNDHRGAKAAASMINQRFSLSTQPGVG